MNKRSASLLGGVAAIALLVPGMVFSDSATADEIEKPWATKASITVYAWPAEEHVADLARGQSVELIQVLAPVTRAKDGGLSIDLGNPQDLPASTVSAHGLVTFGVQEFDGRGGVGSSTFSLRVNPDNQTEWIEPENGSASVSASSRAVRKGFTTRKIKLEMDKVPAPTSGRVAPFWSATVVADDPDGGELDDGSDAPVVVAPAGDEPGYTPAPDPNDPNRVDAGAADCNYHQGYLVWATVATSYPKNGNASWLEYSSSMTTTSGKAASIGSSWANLKKSGTKSTTDNWGQDFAKSSLNRSYRIQMKYGVYSCVNIITGYRWWEFNPIKQTGGTATHTLDAYNRPDWTKCAPVTAGTWWRGAVRGSDYELSYGVKVASLIGFDLMTRHAYSSGTRLNYLISGAPKKMCGNNDVPAWASKMMEKYA